MKKLPGIFLTFIMLGILVFLTVFMCMPLDVAKGNVEKGIIDFRGVVYENTVYTLDGEWEFYYGQKLNPEDFYRGDLTGESFITLPSSWESQGFGKNGTSTYRLQIKAEKDSIFLLYIPHISGAYALWVNGELWVENGAMGDNAHENNYIFRSAMVPVEMGSGEGEIIIQVSNHRYYNSGIGRSMFLGEKTALWNWFQRTRGLYTLTLGGILMIGFYHFSLYIFRRQEKAYLLFSALCVLCFLRFALEDGGVLEMLGLGHSIEGVLRGYYVLLMLHVGTIAMFCIYVFRQDFYEKYRWRWRLYLLLGSVFFSIMPMFIPYDVIRFVSLAMGLLPIFLAIFIGFTSHELKKDPWLILFLISLILYATVGTVFKTILQDTWFMFGLLNNAFLILVQSLSLSRSYAHAFNLVEQTNENLEAIVQERTVELQSANNAMKELMGNISHDLKTPLTVMSLNLEKLAVSPRNQEDKEYKKLIRIAYNKNLDLQRLTQNLFEVSRIETGRVLYSPEWISVSKLLAQVQSKYGDYLDSVGIAFNITSSTEGFVSADRQKIWSVFDNIIYNMVRYTKPEGEISITTGKITDDGNGQSSIEIIVQDTGCGIAPEHLPHIFERFYKVSAGRGGDGESGVGLYIAASVMKGLGGRIWAQSEVGHGTAFHLTFLYKKT